MDRLARHFLHRNPDTMKDAELLELLLRFAVPEPEALGAPPAGALSEPRLHSGGRRRRACGSRGHDARLRRASAPSAGIAAAVSHRAFRPGNAAGGQHVLRQLSAALLLRCKGRDRVSSHAGRHRQGALLPPDRPRQRQLRQRSRAPAGAGGAERRMPPPSCWHTIIPPVSRFPRARTST